MHPRHPEKILRLPAVMEITQLGRSAIYKAVAEKRFPAPIALAPGCRATGWLESEIAAHQDRCKALRRERKPPKRAAARRRRAAS